MYDIEIKAQLFNLTLKKRIGLFLINLGMWLQGYKWQQ